MTNYVFLRTAAQVVAVTWGGFEIGTWLCPYLAMLGPETLSWVAFLGIASAISLGLLAIDLHRKSAQLASTVPPTPSVLPAPPAPPTLPTS